jgi:hypothetical protein
MQKEETRRSTTKSEKTSRHHHIFDLLKKTTTTTPTPPHTWKWIGAYPKCKRNKHRSYRSATSSAWLKMLCCWSKKLLYWRRREVERGRCEREREREAKRESVRYCSLKPNQLKRAHLDLAYPRFGGIWTLWFEFFSGLTKRPNSIECNQSSVGVCHWTIHSIIDVQCSYLPTNAYTYLLIEGNLTYYYCLSSTLLHTTSVNRSFYFIFYVFIWFSIIHHYFCQCQI